MQALRLKPLRINNIITTPLIKPEALPNKERPRLYVSAFPQPEKSLPKMPHVIYSRPAVALPSAASSITFGREQCYQRPRIDNLLSKKERTFVALHLYFLRCFILSFWGILADNNNKK